MVLGRLVAKVLQHADRSRAVLDFIEDNQRLTGIDGLAHCKGEVGDDSLRVPRGLKQLGILARHTWSHLLERHVHIITVSGCTEFLECPGFSNLPSTLENKGFAIGRGLPFIQPAKNVTLHGGSFLP